MDRMMTCDYRFDESKLQVNVQILSISNNRCHSSCTIAHFLWLSPSLVTGIFWEYSSVVVRPPKYGKVAAATSCNVFWVKRAKIDQNK